LWDLAVDDVQLIGIGYRSSVAIAALLDDVQLIGMGYRVKMDRSLKAPESDT
jgi:hypothetical protein